MKHIGWCLDQIMIEMGKLPKEIISSVDRIKALRILNEALGYTATLDQLVYNPKFKEYLHQLERTPIEGVRLKAHEVEELIDELENIVVVVKEDIEELRDTIRNHPELWSRKKGQIMRLIYNKFCDEMGQLRREFQVVLHAEEELRQLVTSKEHLVEFRKFQDSK